MFTEVRKLARWLLSGQRQFYTAWWGTAVYDGPPVGEVPDPVASVLCSRYFWICSPLWWNWLHGVSRWPVSGRSPTLTFDVSSHRWKPSRNSSLNCCFLMTAHFLPTWRSPTAHLMQQDSTLHAHLEKPYSTFDAARQHTSCPLGFMMLYYQTKFGCKWTSSSEFFFFFKEVIFRLYKPLLWPWHWGQWTTLSA